MNLKRYVLLLLVFLVFLVTASAGWGASARSDVNSDAAEGRENERREILRLLEESKNQRRRDAQQGLASGQEAYDRAINIRDTLLQIRAMNAIGSSNWMLGRYDLAVRNHSEALQLAERLHSDHDIGVSNNNLGLAFRNLGMAERAEGCFRQAILLRSRLKAQRGLSRSLMNLGLVFFEYGRLDSAYALTQQSLEIARKQNDTLILASDLYYLGRIEKVRGRIAASFDLMQSALSLFEGMGDRNGIALVSSDISRILLQMNNIEQAQKLASDALKNALLLNSRFAIREGCESLTSIYAAKGDYRRAYEYLTMFKATDDSLRNEAALLRTAQLEIEREIAIREKVLAFEAKQKELSLEATLRSAATLRNSLIAGTILLALLATVLLFAYRSKQKSNLLVLEQNSLVEKANSELSSEIETRERLFSIIGHDLRGPIGNIAGMLDYAITDESVTSNEKEELLEAARESAHASQLVLNRLLDWAHSQRKEIHFNPEIGDMRQTVTAVIALLGQQAKAKNIQLTWDSPPLDRFKYDNHMVSIILENLLSNAIKFTPVDGHVNIQIQRIAQCCQIRVKDDGRGMNQDRLNKIRNRESLIPERGTAHEMSHGLGLDLCYRLTALHGGELTVESEEGRGTEFSLRIPVQ
ncbi:MAG: tetratricopeptide repeat-containing sensor histidine kinase [Bacteroidota bacterium]